MDVVVSKSATVLKLLASKDQALLIRRDAFLVLDLLFHALDVVCCFHVESNSLASKSSDKDLHCSTPESQYQVESRFFCYVVVADGLIAIELLSTEDKPLLIRWDSFFILDLGLDHFDVVGWLDLESDGLAGEGAYKDLHELLMFFRELVDIIDYYYKLLIIYMISFNRAW